MHCKVVHQHKDVAFVMLLCPILEVRKKIAVVDFSCSIFNKEYVKALSNVDSNHAHSIVLVAIVLPCVVSNPRVCDI